MKTLAEPHAASRSPGPLWQQHFLSVTAGCCVRPSLPPLWSPRKYNLRGSASGQGGIGGQVAWRRRRCSASVPVPFSPGTALASPPAPRHPSVHLVPSDARLSPDDLDAEGLPGSRARSLRAVRVRRGCGGIASHWRMSHCLEPQFQGAGVFALLGAAAGNNLTPFPLLSSSSVSECRVL